MAAIHPRRATHPNPSLAPKPRRVLGAPRYREARARPATVPGKRRDARTRAGTAAGGSRWRRGRAVPASTGGGRAAATPGSRSGREGGTCGGEASGSAKGIGRGFQQTFSGLWRDGPPLPRLWLLRSAFGLNGHSGATAAPLAPGSDRICSPEAAPVTAAAAADML